MHCDGGSDDDNDDHGDNKMIIEIDSQMYGVVIFNRITCCFSSALSSSVSLLVFVFIWFANGFKLNDIFQLSILRAIFRFE